VNDVSAPVATNQDQELIELTPLEETVQKITRIKQQNKIRDLDCRVVKKGKKRRLRAGSYIIQHLYFTEGLSRTQIKDLSTEDFNRLPEMVLARRRWKALLLGWIPIFGWVYAYRYLLFKKRMWSLESLHTNDRMFNDDDIYDAFGKAFV
jgi:hypothetical protein